MSSFERYGLAGPTTSLAKDPSFWSPRRITIRYFLDAMLLMQEVHRETGRRVSTLTAASSMKRKLVGFFARMMGGIPVVRAADEAQAGAGQITLSEEDECLVLGHGTKFTSEFTPKMQIKLAKSAGSSVAQVVDVLSDTQLRIGKAFPGIAKIREKIGEAQAAGKDGLSYQRLPYVDQNAMFQNVYRCLDDHGAIGIFPEGGSHDRTDLLPLKAGVSLMALGAMANNPESQVKIVPVGLSYFHAHRFRSRAVIEFGAPLDVPLELIDMFKEGGARKREAVGTLLDTVYDALKTVTLRAPDYETLMLIQAARRLYEAPLSQQLPLDKVIELNKRFLQAYMHFKDEPKVQKLRNDVLQYNQLLRYLGLRDHQVPKARKEGWKTLGLLMYRLALLAIWAVLALPGVVLNSPIFITASIISHRKAKDDVAKSDVKIAGRDVLASWKVLVALGVTPVVYASYALLATVIAVNGGVPSKVTIWTPFVVFAVLPIVAYAALKFGEAGMDVMKSLPPLLVALAPGEQRSLDRLKRMREVVSQELADTVNEFGPKLFDDFDEWRLLVPSASTPPLSGQSGSLRLRKRVAGADAQGKLLNHPMTWLDDRIFGWSPGPSRGETPDMSDEDSEMPDYEDFGSIPGGSDSPASRSRRSYADLQHLRRTPSPVHISIGDSDPANRTSAA
ncbi:hypothetical protein C8Q80DRAFT_1274206 [Daedaleopsis nitida]|nr:hypothetical protein C8Q80DRAFT_1274206 [Daedaleopsis nitida]